MKVTNAEFLSEILKSKENEQLTDNTVNMFIEISKEVLNRYPILDDFKEDCLAYAVEKSVELWKGFNIERTTNAIAYFTQIIKCSIASNQLKRIKQYKLKKLEV